MFADLILSLLVWQDENKQRGFRYKVCLEPSPKECNRECYGCEVRFARPCFVSEHLGLQDEERDDLEAN